MYTFACGASHSICTNVTHRVLLLPEFLITRIHAVKLRYPSLKRSWFG